MITTLKRAREKDIVKTILFDLRALKKDLAPVVPDFILGKPSDIREFNYELDTWIYIFDRCITERKSKEKTKNAKRPAPAR